MNGSDLPPDELPSLAALVRTPVLGPPQAGDKLRSRPAKDQAPSDRKTLSHRVYERIRNAILHGEVPDGTELNQVELASVLGVSRVPVREALLRLQAEQLVDMTPFQRVVVTSLSKTQVLEFYDIRQELEVFGALRTRARDDFETVVLPDARETASLLGLDQSGEDWFQADLEFHRVLNGRSSGTAALVDQIRFRIYRYRHLHEPNLERREQVIAEHAGILAAVENGDPVAVRAAIEAHVGGTRALITRAF
ncbi:GntR family transcriptional regulator [Streptomyces sp. NBC_01239]|uniref:GntR family transcriptional regulator n=1 Tax=Streptomyces sp. NBC_01239 TaxID=2903792 RepID=UPI00225B5271|nr:GntR family transcriptional regulator [Streptomyces sp. NBC_01239]MCX4817973.1 GntR family transcriptional regulator [Streptomyces sp. NBC_01239]